MTYRHVPKLADLTLGLLLACLCSCANDLDKVAAVTLPENAPDRTVKNAVYYYSDSGIVRNKLTCGTLDEFLGEDPHTRLSDGVELLFFDAKGEEGSRLIARRGLILQEKGIMEVQEEVVFTNPKGEKLETEKLIWSQDSDRVHTDEFVRISRRDDIIYGKGLEANADFSRYTITQITGSLYMDGDTLAE